MKPTSAASRRMKRTSSSIERRWRAARLAGLDTLSATILKALPNARIMVHQPSGGFQGQVTDIMLHAQEIMNLKKRLNEIYVKHTGQPIKKIEDALERDYPSLGGTIRDYDTGARRLIDMMDEFEITNLDRLGDTRDRVKSDMGGIGLDVPILFDYDQLVGEQLKITRAAEVLVINPKGWTVAYRGPISGPKGETWARDAITAIAMISVFVVAPLFLGALVT